MSKLFRKFISSIQTKTTIDDIYFGNNLLLLSGDIGKPLRGLPVITDQSVYKRFVIYPTILLDERCQLNVVLNNSENSNFVLRNQSHQIRVDSFIHFDNRSLNSLIDNGEIAYGHPAYLLGHNTASPDINLNSDFVVEFSFYSSIQAVRQNNLQIIFSLGDFFTVNAGRVEQSRGGLGFAIYIRNQQLIFNLGGEFVLIDNLQLLEWHDICLIRDNNTLFVYVNRVLVHEYLSSTNTIVSNQLFYLGCAGNLRYSNPAHLALTSFTGGLSNFRITDTNRYPNHRLQFSQKLSFPVVITQPKTDFLFDRVLFYFPCLYDLMEYSSHKNHFIDRFQWVLLPPEVGGIIINETIYETDYESVQLNNSWCLEFYFTFAVAERPTFFNHSNLNTLNLLDNNSFVRKTVILQIFADDNDDFAVLEIGAVYCENLSFSSRGGSLNNNGLYLYLKVSSDGETYRQFAGEVFIVPHIEHSSQDIVFDDLTEAKFFIKESHSSRPASKQANSQTIVSFYNEPPLHFAIQRLANNLVFLINGETSYSLSFPNNLAINNKYKLRIGDGQFYFPLINRNSQTVEYVIKGLRFTNTARYNVMNPNNFYFENSIQPLPLADGQLEHPRLRILAILRNENEFTDAEEVSWTVSLSQRVNSISAQDFLLVQQEGLSNARIIGIEQINLSQYLITASTGIGSGTLGLNFIDRRSLTLFRTTLLVSAFVGELNFSGEVYTINRNLPEVLLTSTSSPYVFDTYTVRLVVTNEVFTFDKTKIAVVNGTLTNFSRVTNNVFTFDITPIQTGLTSVQVAKGFSRTASGLLSRLSQTLTRIYDTHAVVLQLPLNATTQRNDISPSNLQFSEISPSQYDETRFPIGETSSLRVEPSSESGGLFFNNFRIVKTLESLTLGRTLDYTFELFYRKDISGGTSHIISFIGTNGFSVISHNNLIVVSSSPTSTSTVFTNVEATELLNTFNHVAITRRNGVVRFYINGSRRAISRALRIQPYDCNIQVGYREFFVSQVPTNISNVRIIVGKALYTGVTHDIPRLPFNVPLQIQEIGTLLNHVTIYSTNKQPNRARTEDNIIVRFSSIVPLTNLQVQIRGRNAELSQRSPNEYEAFITVESNDIDGLVEFVINIPAQQFISATTVNKTTNSTFVLIDNEPLSVFITPLQIDNNHSIFDCRIVFSRDVTSFSIGDLTLENLIATNLIVVSSKEYLFTVRALATGVVSVRLDENIVTDIIGNFNLASNVVNRSVTVVPISTDVFADNVLFYLLGDSLQDISGRNVKITATDITIDYENVPPAINSSLRLNGSTSFIRFDIGEDLHSSLPYTLELFVFVRGSVNFHLQPPKLNSANNVQSRYFNMSWENVPNATGYEVILSDTPTFVRNVSKFSTNNNSIEIGSKDSLTESLFLDGHYVRTENNFGISLNRFTTYSNVIVDISTNTSFDRERTIFTKEFYYGTTEFAQLFQPSSNTTETQSTFDTTQILHGIIGNFQVPFLFFVSQENTIRFYDSMDYRIPAVFEDVEFGNWYYIRIVNNISRNKLELYVNNELVDRITSTTIEKNITIGRSFSYFMGNIAGVRITKGVSRPTVRGQTLLPYGTIANAS